MVSFMHRWNLEKLTAHMCRFNMTATDGEHSGLVKKPTSFITNAEYLRNLLELHCTGGHRQMHLINGRAANARIYPHDLCKQFVIGIKEQMTADGKITDKNSLHSLMHNTAKNDANDCLTTYLDDLFRQNP